MPTGPLNRTNRTGYCEGLAHFCPHVDLIPAIIFDCPPRLSLVSFAALCASQHVIIPLEAADWGAQGIVQVTAAVDHVRRDQLQPGFGLARLPRVPIQAQPQLPAQLRQQTSRALRAPGI